MGTTTIGPLLSPLLCCGPCHPLPTHPCQTTGHQPFRSGHRFCRSKIEAGTLLRSLVFVQILMPPNTVLPFGGMVGKPVAGWLADCLRQQRIVFLLALLLSGFYLHTIFFFANLTLHLCRPFLFQYPIGVLHQRRFHSSL